MRCETCRGEGKRWWPRDLGARGGYLPCDDCGGTGFAHCCEGDQACPEPDDDDPSEAPLQ